MKNLELVRLEVSPEGTFGILKIDKRIFCMTLEPPDLENEYRSSIPTGQYVCVPYESPKFKNTWLVQDVHARSKILFHPGNVVTDTAGCILLGHRIGYLRNNRALLNSGMTFRDFLAELEGEESAHLTVTEVY